MKRQLNAAIDHGLDMCQDDRHYAKIAGGIIAMAVVVAMIAAFAPPLFGWIY